MHSHFNYSNAANAFRTIPHSDLVDIMRSHFHYSNDGDDICTIPSDDLVGEIDEPPFALLG